MDAFAARTGRALGFVRPHRLEKAKHVVVGLGAAAETVESVVDALRSKKESAGSLAIEWLRPFPAKEIRDALAGADIVTVIERGEDVLSADRPLLREVRSALAGREVRVLSATAGLGGAPIVAADITAVFENMKSAEPRERLHLGLERVTVGGANLPNRDVLLSAVRRRFPHLDKAAPPVVEAPDLRPDGARTIVIVAREPVDTAEVLTAAANALAKSAGTHVRSRSLVLEDGVWIGRVTCAPAPFNDPGDRTTVDALLVAHAAMPAYFDATEDLVSGGLIVLGEGVSFDVIAARARGERTKERLAGFPRSLRQRCLGKTGGGGKHGPGGGETDLKPVDAPAGDRAGAAARPARDAGSLAERTDVRYDSPARFGTRLSSRGFWARRRRRCPIPTSPSERFPPAPRRCATAWPAARPSRCSIRICAPRAAIVGPRAPTRRSGRSPSAPKPC
ncbi:MAG: hypothetical protein M5R36_24425 [Deltaproteobacteria bacterium]|nr:hypothetical protein [Deltaproteobacteria bacterium]